MTRTEIKEITDGIVENAKFILQEMRCRQAYTNYVDVKELCEFLLHQEQAVDELVDVCNDAAHTIRNYKKLVRIAQDTVGESTWQKILEEAYKESE